MGCEYRAGDTVRRVEFECGSPDIRIGDMAELIEPNSALVWKVRNLRTGDIYHWDVHYFQMHTANPIKPAEPIPERLQGIRVTAPLNDEQSAAAALRQSQMAAANMGLAVYANNYQQSFRQQAPGAAPLGAQPAAPGPCIDHVTRKEYRELENKIRRAESEGADACGERDRLRSWSADMRIRIAWLERENERLTEAMKKARGR